MAKNDLFANLRDYRQPLSPSQRVSAAETVIRSAKLGLRYSYKLQSAAGILRMSTDEIQTAIHLFRLDAYSVLSCVRIPWWSLAEFLLDPAEDVDFHFYRWVDSLPRSQKDVCCA